MLLESLERPPPVSAALPLAHVFAMAAKELPASRWAHALCTRFRRLVLALLHEHSTRDALPSFFHGHAPGGGPLRSNGHRHLFYAAWSSLPDGRLDRIAVLAPSLADRTTPAAGPAELTQLAHALVGLSTFFAGPHGVLQLRPLAVEPRADGGVFGRSDRWVSASVYLGGRERRKPQETLAGILAADALRECGHRGLPFPEVAFTKVARGTTGSLRGWLRLTFPEPVDGPLLLGRRSHFGAGLFRAEMANVDR